MIGNNPRLLSLVVLVALTLLTCTTQHVSATGIPDPDESLFIRGMPESAGKMTATTQITGRITSVQYEEDWNTNVQRAIVAGTCLANDKAICYTRCSFVEYGIHGFECVEAVHMIQHPDPSKYLRSPHITESQTDPSPSPPEYRVMALAYEVAPDNNPGTPPDEGMVSMINATSVGDAVYEASNFTFCSVSPCAREVTAWLTNNHVILVTNTGKPEAYSFGWDGTFKDMQDLTQIAPSPPIPNSGRFPKIDFNQGPDTGLVTTLYQSGPDTYSICAFEFYLDDLPGNGGISAVSDPSYRCTAPVVSVGATPVFSAPNRNGFSSDDWAFTVGYPNGSMSVVTYTPSFPSFEERLLFDIPTLPEPADSALIGPMYQPRVFLFRFPTGSGFLPLVGASFGGNFYGVVIKDETTLQAGNMDKTMNKFPSLFPELAISGGASPAWGGGLLLATPSTPGDPFTAIAIYSHQSAVGFITPATNTFSGVASADNGMTKPYDASIIGAGFAFSADIDTDDAYRGWRGYAGAVAETIMTSGADPCLRMQVDCAQVLCAPSPTPGAFVHNPSGGTFEVYSSPLGDTFAVKFLTSHFRGNDVADILEGVAIGCEKNTALFPFPTVAALKLDYNNGRGEYHLSQYQISFAAPTALGSFRPLGFVSGSPVNGAELSPPIAHVINPATDPNDPSLIFPFFDRADSNKAVDLSASPVTYWDDVTLNLTMQTFNPGDQFFFMNGTHEITVLGTPTMFDVVVGPGYGMVYPSVVGPPLTPNFFLSGPETSREVTFDATAGLVDGAVSALLAAYHMKVGGSPVDLVTRRELEVKYEYSGVVPSRHEMIVRVGVELTSGGTPPPVGNPCDAIPDNGQCSTANETCIPNCRTATGFTCDPPSLENPGASSCNPVGLSEGPTPKPKEEERSDLFEIETDPATSSVAWTAYVLALLLVVVIAITLYKRALNLTADKPNYVRTNFLRKLLRDHSLLGIVFVHKSDPLSRIPRLLSLVLQLNVTYMTSVAVLILFQDEEGSITGFILSALLSSIMSVVLGVNAFTAGVRSTSARVSMLSKVIGFVMAFLLSGANVFLILGNSLLFPDSLVDYHQTVIVAFVAGLFTDFSIVEPLTIVLKCFLWADNTVYEASEYGSTKGSAVAPLPSGGSKPGMEMEMLAGGGAVAAAAGGTTAAVAAGRTKKHGPFDEEQPPAGPPESASANSFLGGDPFANLPLEGNVLAVPTEQGSSRTQPNSARRAGTAVPLRRSVSGNDGAGRADGRGLNAVDGPPPGSANINTFAFQR